MLKFSYNLYSNCVKWQLPNITSLYTYIDIQVQCQYNPTNKIQAIVNNTRFIKLFPEGGVFNDFSKVKSSTSTSTWTNHVAYIATTVSGVCLIELNAKEFNAQIDTASNTLALWLFYGTLLETDYLDPSAAYPIANLSSQVSGFGYSSSIFRSNTPLLKSIPRYCSY